MPDETRISRRSLAALLAGAANVSAQESPGAGATPEAADAAALLRKNAEAIAGVRVERQVEPSFRFEA